MTNYILKRNFFDKKKVIDKIANETDSKNVFFMRYKGQLHTVKLDITEFFANQIDNYF